MKHQAIKILFLHLSLVLLTGSVVNPWQPEHASATDNAQSRTPDTEEDQAPEERLSPITAFYHVAQVNILITYQFIFQFELSEHCSLAVDCCSQPYNLGFFKILFERIIVPNAP